MGKTRTTVGGDALPASAAAFRRLVLACRTEDDRNLLLDRIRAEFPSFKVERIPWPRRPAVLPEKARRFETRLLEFVRTPKFGREFGRQLQPSHFYAWHDLTRMRSPRFASMLRAWMDGDDPFLASEAAERLAWMAVDRDLPRFERLLTDGPWRLRGGIGRGLAGTSSHRWASRAFRTRMFESLASIACGEVPIPIRREVEDALAQIGDGLRGLNQAGMIRLFRSERALHPRNRAVAGAIFALEFEQQYGDAPYKPVDPCLLWPVFEALRGGQLRLPVDPGSGRETGPERTMGGILLLAADGDPARAELECGAILRGKRRSDEGTLVRYARAARRRCRNIPEPDAVLRVAGRGGAIRGDALRIIGAYSLLWDAVEEGLAYCLSSLDDRWRRARDGLLVLGNDRAAAILEEAGAIFERSALARLPRSRRLDEELDEATRRALEALDVRLGRHWRAVRRAVELYIEEHPGKFAAAAPRRRTRSSSA